MPESGNYFAWLGLAPGTYTPQELADRLEEFRRFEPDEARLADATMAFHLLRDPGRQTTVLRSLGGQLADRLSAPLATTPQATLASGGPDPQIESAFTLAVASMLEGDTGVLRYSSRKRLLDLASRLGIVPFEANLLIERARFRISRKPAWHGGPEPADAQTPASSRLSRWLLAVVIALALAGSMAFYLLA